MYRLACIASHVSARMYRLSCIGAGFFFCPARGANDAARDARARSGRYYIGSLWMAIMRQQRGRIAGIKMLSKVIPQVQGSADEYDDLGADDEGDQF